MTSTTDLPYLDDLLLIRKALSLIKPDFPHLACEHSTRSINQIIGLTETAGHYMGFHEREWHAWNYDPERDIYIDISMTQFSDKHDDISIVTPESPLLRQSTIEEERYRKHIPWLDGKIFEVVETYHRLKK